MKLPNEICTSTPRPVRTGSGLPQPALLAARSSEARRLAEHLAAEGDRVLARLFRQLVDKAFDGEDVVVRADPAPEARRHGRRLLTHVFHAEIGNIVGNVGGAIDGVDIDPPLERGRQPARDHRRARDTMLPADDPAIRQARPEAVAIDRPIEAVLDVLFAAPHDLNRSVDVLGDAHGTLDAVNLQPAAEAAAEQVIVDGDLVERQPGDLRCRGLRSR
jgi:hypothetical protein